MGCRHGRAFPRTAPGSTVTLVEDSCAAYDPAGHGAAVATGGRHVGAVTTSGELARAWTTGDRAAGDVAPAPAAPHT